jgi:hypothetical protein
VIGRSVGGLLTPCARAALGACLVGWLDGWLLTREHRLPAPHPQVGEKVRTKPSVVVVEDELDMYGRPKERLVLPTDALEEGDREKVLGAAEALERRNEARKGQ